MSTARYLPLIGRLLIGLPFMLSGMGKLMGYDATIAYIKSTSLPLPASLAFVGAIAVEIGCSTLMIVGYQTRLVAAVFVGFCLVTAVFFHAHFSDQNQMFHFIKNLVMAGGLLQFVVYGAGAISIDSRRLRAREPRGALQSAN